MIRKIKFSGLPGFSKLFIKKINEYTSLNKQILFPTKQKTEESIISELHDLPVIPEFFDLIEKTNRKLKLSQAQRENIYLLKDEKSFFCTATVRPGFLGGPANIFLKILSVVINCAQLNKRYRKYNFIPMVWFDDDVHDNFESSLANIYNKNGNLESIFCEDDLIKTDPSVIHRRFFGSEIESRLKNIIHLIPESHNKEKIEKLIFKSYKKDFSWSYSSALFLNSILRNLGILFVFASDARLSGFFNNLTAKELSGRGDVLEIIKSELNNSKFKGKDFVDKASIYNLNHHKGNKVDKCEKRESGGLTDYSPNVMLKSIFYDSLLPVIYRIASPSELIYSDILTDVYSHFEVVQPFFVPRYSVTFVNYETRLFFKENRSDLLEVISGYKSLQRMALVNDDIKKILNWTYPNQNLQERYLSLLSIVNSAKTQFSSICKRQLEKFDASDHLIFDI